MIRQNAIISGNKCLDQNFLPKFVVLKLRNIDSFFTLILYNCIDYIFKYNTAVIISSEISVKVLVSSSKRNYLPLLH